MRSLGLAKPSLSLIPCLGPDGGLGRDAGRNTLPLQCLLRPRIHKVGSSPLRFLGFPFLLYHG